MEYSSQVNDAKLAYDLRQIYAKIVGQHLIDVAAARKIKNYPAYFEALEDLYIVSKHNFKSTKKNKKFKSKKQKPTFQSLKELFFALATEHQQAYLGNSTSAEEVSKIKTSLNNIELFLWKKIKEAKMIGTKDGEEGIL